MVLQLDVEKTDIDSSEVEFIGFKSDELGRVFQWRGNLYRAIQKNAEEEVLDLFKSGLLDELIKSNFFPETQVTSFAIGEYELVLEHKKIEIVNYPFEWSFDMLKDAALTLLKVARIARKYNYELIDGHCYNVIFDNTHPYFIDIGSFKKASQAYKGWIAYPEFLKFFYYPLRLWSKVPSLARTIGHHPAAYMVHAAVYLQFLNVAARFISLSKLETALNIFYKIRVAAPMSPEEIEHRASGRFKGIFLLLKKMKLLPWRQISLDKLIKKVERLPAPKSPSMWKDYHSQHYDAGKKLKSTPRFDRIIEVLNGLPVNSVFEVAGNQGVVSRLILERTGVRHVICSDYDDNAINILYNSIKDRRLALSPIVLDIKYPVNFNHTIPAEQRFKSDAVFALALTHHLVLTQNIPLDEVFNQLQKYASKYIFVEFMPMGLFNGVKAPPVPDWYNQEWFRKNFEDFFDLILEEQLEPNRILFLGKVRI